MTTSLFKPESIHELAGVEPDLPFDDLEILGEITANSKVIGLGEPTHGQKEINQLRDRMTRYLIEHQGFRVVAVEDSAIRCRRINDAIVHGIGTPESALAMQNFWTWRTKEVLAMLEWLHDRNESHPEDVVRFIGVDIQDLESPAVELASTLVRLGLEAENPYLDRLAEIETITFWGDESFDENMFQADLEMLAELRDIIVNLEHSDPPDVDLGLDCVLALEQSLQLWRENRLAPPTGSAARWNRRDDVMATRTLAPTLNGEKVVLWAHNGHVQCEAFPGLPEGSITTGLALRAERNLNYIAISGAFGSGSYRARSEASGEMQALDVGHPPAGSIDHYLWSASDSPALIVDLEMPGTILFEDQITRWGDASLLPDALMRTTVRPGLGSNAIAFVRQATPSEPLQSRTQPGHGKLI